MFSPGQSEISSEFSQCEVYGPNDAHYNVVLYPDGQITVICAHGTPEPSGFDRLQIIHVARTHLELP